MVQFVPMLPNQPLEHAMQTLWHDLVDHDLVRGEAMGWGWEGAMGWGWGWGGGVA